MNLPSMQFDRCNGPAIYTQAIGMGMVYSHAYWVNNNQTQIMVGVTLQYLQSMVGVTLQYHNKCVHPLNSQQTK